MKCLFLHHPKTLLTSVNYLKYYDYIPFAVSKLLTTSWILKLISTKCYTRFPACKDIIAWILLWIKNFLLNLNLKLACVFYYNGMDSLLLWLILCLPVNRIKFSETFNACASLKGSYSSTFFSVLNLFEDNHCS